MGVTAVWISAPYENRDTESIDYQSDGSYDRWTSFHGYHVRNYFATNKHFGTLNEFKELRDALHENGIKLIIDFVTNHTSREMNPTAGNIPEDGKLYEPDRKETIRTAGSTAWETEVTTAADSDIGIKTWGLWLISRRKMGMLQNTWKKQRCSGQTWASTASGTMPRYTWMQRLPRG